MGLFFWRKFKTEPFEHFVIDLTVGAKLSDDYFLPLQLEERLIVRNLRLDVTTEKAEFLIEEWEEEHSVLKIREAYNAHDWSTVFTIAEARISVYDEIDVHIYLLRAYYTSKNLEKCMEVCYAILAFDNRNIEAHRFLARCSKNKSEADIAGEHYLKVVEYSPTDADALQSLIRIRYNQSKHSEVVEYSGKLILEHPQVRDGHLFNARSSVILGNLDNAITSLSVLIEMNSDDLEALVTIGKAYHILERYETAQKHLEKALSLDPDERRSRRTLGLIYDRLGMSEKALQMYTKECIFEPMMFSNWEKKINLLYRVNRQDEARECISQLLILEEYSLDSYLLANEIALSFYWSDTSTELLDYCSEKWGHQNDYYSKIASITFRSGELTKTWGYLEQGLQRDPNQSDLLELKSNLLSFLNSTNTSEGVLFNAISNDVPLLAVECHIMNLIHAASQIQPYRSEERDTNLIMISSSLGRGGAERQVVSCLGGLMGEKQYLDTCLYCYSLAGSRGHKQTYESEVRDTGVSIKEYGSRNDWNAEFNDSEVLLAPWKKYLDKLPISMQREVEPLFLNFLHKKPKIVHAWQDQTNINVAIAASMAGVPGIVMFARSMRPDGKTMMHIRNRPYLRRAYQALSMNVTRALLCHNSSVGCQSYEDWLGVSAGNFEVIHNGVDFEGIEQSSQGASISEILNLPNDAFVIGGVFRLVIEKRPRLWVEAIAQVVAKRKNVHAIHVGGGGLTELIQGHINEHGMENHIHLVGQTTQVKAWLDEFDIFLLTSIVEGLPNVLIEAQAFGVPVISTDAGGSRDTFIEEETGYLALEPTADKIADLLLTCIDNPKWMAAAKSKSREQARKRFSQSAMIERLKEIYSLALQRT